MLCFACRLIQLDQGETLQWCQCLWVSEQVWKQNFTFLRYMWTYDVFRVRQKRYWGSALDRFASILSLFLFFFFFYLILNLSFHLDDSSDNTNCLQNVLFCDHVFFNITNHKNKALPVNPTWLKKNIESFWQIDIITVYPTDLFGCLFALFEISAIVVRFSDTWWATCKWLQFQTTASYVRAKYLLQDSIS